MKEKLEEERELDRLRYIEKFKILLIKYFHVEGTSWNRNNLLFLQ